MSDSEFSDDGYRRRRYERDSDRSLFSDDYSSSGKEDSNDDSSQSFEFDNIVLCKTHKVGNMTNDCAQCATVLKRFTDPDMFKKLTGDTKESGGGDAQSGGNTSLSRYLQRCDEPTPTLHLSAESLGLAKEIFTRGVFKDKTKWKETIKDYLLLPPSHHEELLIDLQTEPLFDRIKNEKRFNNVFKFHQELKASLCNLRLSQRPLFSLVENINKELDTARQFGERIGINFPRTAPPRSGSNVPRTRKVLDNLAFDNGDKIFPVPDIIEFQFRYNLDPEQAVAVSTLFDNYRADVKEKMLEIYSSHCSTLTMCDDLLIFYLDLYSHCDASLRYLLREKLASLFKINVKNDILSDKYKDGKETQSRGLFGGEDQFRARLTNVTKRDSLLEKALVPRYRSKSRSRSRDRNDRRRGDRGGDTHSRSSRRSEDRGGDESRSTKKHFKKKSKSSARDDHKEASSKKSKK